MSEKLIVFVDDATLVPDISGSHDVLFISLDTQAAGELAGRTEGRIRSVTEYSEKRFGSYDELYGHFEAEIRERFRPKDPTQQDRFLFEVLWDDILLNFIGVHYIEALVREVFDRERPARVELAIADRELNALFQRVVQRLS